MTVNDFPPTRSMIEVRDELVGEIDRNLKKWYVVRDQEIVALNKMIDEKSLQTIIIKSDKTKSK
jgi:hypothetical protein